MYLLFRWMTEIRNLFLLGTCSHVVSDPHLTAQLGFGPVHYKTLCVTIKSTIYNTFVKLNEFIFFQKKITLLPTLRFLYFTY
jgi:hypothetical protein